MEQMHTSAAPKSKVVFTTFILYDVFLFLGKHGKDFSAATVSVAAVTVDYRNVYMAQNTADSKGGYNRCLTRDMVCARLRRSCGQLRREIGGRPSPATPTRTPTRRLRLPRSRAGSGHAARRRPFQRPC
jgi:hypothetical protein